MENIKEICINNNSCNKFNNNSCNKFNNNSCNKFNNNSCNKFNNKCYDKQTVATIKGIYVAAVFLWIVAIFVLDLMQPDIFIWFFLSIPIIVWAINITNIDSIGCDTENQMFKGNLLTFGFLITIILLNWKSPMKMQDKSKFFLLLVVAFILLMISLVDVWVEEKKLSVVKHIKSMLHTSSLVILALALYLYYISQQKSESY